jgi:hypothetical protein
MIVAHENDHDTVVQSTLVPQIWTINLDFSVSPIAVTVEGDGCLIQHQGESQNLYWNNCGRWQFFLVVEAKDAYLTASGGHVCPIYVRRIGNTIRLSNVASRLMQPSDTLRIDAFVLLQNLSGLPYPQNNFFKEIRLLEASAEYRLTAYGIERLRSVLEGATVLSQDEVLDMAITHWEEHLSSGADVAVLLSGGYDSRLNLAIACHAARRYGNRVKAFHEHKNVHEESIAIAVASAAGIPLIVHNRRKFLRADRAVVLDPSFIDLQSGFYRDNLIRWHNYLGYIRTELPGCVIMGLGAEAHKGKFYRQIESIAADALKVFGIDDIVVKAIARKLGLVHQDQDSQRSFFETLALQATAFGDFAAQVDYVHYQTYIANGYGHRCHDLQQYYGIPFPFLDNRFLAAVFALPQNKKENFALVKRGIERLGPTLATIPYSSANDKALGPAVRKPATDAMRGIVRLLGPIYYDWFPPSRKGRANITPAEREVLAAIRSNSHLTDLLTRLALESIEKIPFIRMDYLIEACLYFSLLEQKMGVICTIDGGEA